MKCILTILLLWPAMIFGQITLEYTYTSTFAYTHRIDLKNEGVKHYYLDTMQKKLYFFNEDHSQWKTVPLPHNPKNNDMTQFKITQHFYNDDDNIEITYAYRKNNGVQGITVINQYGNQLFNADAGTVGIEMSYEINQLEGVEDKLMLQAEYPNGTANQVVHYLPSLEQEHIFFNTPNLHRINLEQAGIKYYILRKENSNAELEIYNSDFTLWRSINLITPNGYTIGEVTALSQAIFNNDEYIDIAYYCENTAGETKAYIINENGIVILQNENGKPSISQLYGLNNKLIITQGDNEANNIYSLPNLFYDHSYGYLRRENLEASGETYVTYAPNQPNDSVMLYHDNHLFWRSVRLFPPSGTTAKMLDVNEHKFNMDNYIETISHYSGANEGVQVVNENGLVLLDQPGANHCYLSQFPGKPNKLVCHSALPNVLETRIFALPVTTATEEISLPVSKATAYPNPFDASVSVDDINVKQLALYNQQGQLIKTQTGPQLDQLEGLPAGVYFIQLDKQVLKVVKQ